MLKNVHVNGTDLAYVEQGSGEPVVLVHGALGDYRTWEQQVDALARRYRVISYSRRYHHPNPCPGDGSDYSYPLHAEDLVALIQTLAGEAVHLAGHSYGGFLAAMVAQRHPHLVRRLVLVEPATFGLLSGTPLAQSVKEGFGRTFAACLPSLDAGDAEGAVRNFVSFVRGEEGYDRLTDSERRQLQDNAPTLKLMTFHPVHPFGRREAEQIRARSLLVEGEQSLDFFRGVTAELRRLVPGAESVVIPAASHMCARDNPAVFNRAVLEFLGKRE